MDNNINIIKNLSKIINTSNICHDDALYNLKEIKDYLGLSKDTYLSDIELFYFLQTNDDIRDYVLNLIYFCIENNHNISNNLLSFIKIFPEKFNKDILNINKNTSYNEIDLHVDNFIKKYNNFYLNDDYNDDYIKVHCNNIIDSSITNNKIQKYCKNNLINNIFFPTYLFINNNIYVKTNQDINNLDFKENKIIYKKLKNDYIYNLNKLNKWTIVTKTTCPYCINVKKLLKEKNIDFFEIDLNNYTSKRNSIFEELDQYTSGYRRVPMVFYYDNFIGGYDDTKKFLNT
jgi:glutaredoxin 3